MSFFVLILRDLFEYLGVHPLIDIGIALRGYGAATVVGGFHLAFALLLGQGYRIVEKVTPGEVAKEFLTGIVHPHDAFKHRHPDILGTGPHQALESGDAVGLGIHGGIVVGLHDPDVFIGQLLNLHV